jgi:hypothetical protein
MVQEVPGSKSSRSFRFKKFKKFQVQKVQEVPGSSSLKKSIFGLF